MTFSKSNLWSTDWRNCLFTCAEIVLHCRWDLQLDTGFGGWGSSKYPISCLGGGEMISHSRFGSGQTHISISAKLNLIRLRQNNSGQSAEEKVKMRMEEERQIHSSYNRPPIKLLTFWDPLRVLVELLNDLISSYSIIKSLNILSLHKIFRILCYSYWAVCVILDPFPGGLGV